MEPLVKHRIPQNAQLIVVLIYLLFLLSIFALPGDTGSSTAALTDPRMVNLFKMAQLIAALLLFVLPTVGFSLLVRAEKKAFLNMDVFPKRIPLITAATICIIAIPFVAAMEEWNLKMHLPSFMAGTEQWMREKEASLGEINKIFFQDRSTIALIINLFVIAFMPAVSEELFFRGLLQRLFIENRMNRHIAVWATAILFSAIHMQFFGFFPRMFLGAVLGYLYLYTGNLWVSIIAHFVNNAFQVVIIQLSDEPVDVSGASAEHVAYPLALVSLAMIAAQIWLLKKYSDRNRFV